MESLSQAIELDATASERVDVLGMTAFHILSLAAKPSIDLFQFLLTSSRLRDAIFDGKDIYGHTPMHYLCKNVGPNSIQLVKTVLHATIDNRIDGLGLERWRQDITAELDQFPNAVGAISREQQAAMIHFKLVKYELLESFFLLELALWKKKNGECKAARTIVSDIHTRKKAKIDKKNIRIHCGADIVISNVLPFLNNMEVPNLE